MYTAHEVLARDRMREYEQQASRSRLARELSATARRRRAESRRHVRVPRHPVRLVEAAASAE